MHDVQTVSLNTLHITIFWLCVALSLFIFAVMFYSILHPRKTRGRKPVRFRSPLWLELSWTTVPVVMAVLMMIPAAQVMFHRDHVAKESRFFRHGRNKWGFCAPNAPSLALKWQSLPFSRSKTPFISAMPEEIINIDDHAFYVFYAFLTPPLAPFTLPHAPPPPPPKPVDPKIALQAAILHGETVYLGACAACHQPDGTGMPPTFPALKGGPVAAEPVSEHVNRVMNGKPGTTMPGFKDALSDQDLADVITYERHAWGNQSGVWVRPEDIKAARQALRYNQRSTKQ